MIEPRCLIGGADIRRPFQGIFAGREKCFVDAVKSFRGCPADKTSSRGRDQKGLTMRGEAGYFEALAILCSKWPVSWSRRS